MPIWTVYIIYSGKRDRYYIGVTTDIQQRVKEHNTGLSPYTKGGTPWTLKHREEFKSIEEAYGREKFLKSKKSRKIIEKVVVSPDVRL